jgi:hypothetical protein
VELGRENRVSQAHVQGRCVKCSAVQWSAPLCSGAPCAVPCCALCRAVAGMTSISVIIVSTSLHFIMAHTHTHTHTHTRTHACQCMQVTNCMMVRDYTTGLQLPDHWLTTGCPPADCCPTTG